MRLGSHLSEESKRKMSISHKGMIFSEEHKKNMRKPKSLEHRKHISEGRKKLWENKTYKNNQVSAFLHQFFKEPTNGEQKFIKICEEYNLPYRYVGNGSMVIDGKCPDFINTSGKKIMIEIEDGIRNSYLIKRKLIFGKYGYDVLVLKNSDLDNVVFVLKEIENIESNNTKTV